MEPISIAIILGSIVIIVIGYFLIFRKKGKGSDWKMDPRLKDLSKWAYACMLDVTGLDPDELPVPPVKGVDEPWGSNNAFGTYYSNFDDVTVRSIKVQITRPYAHLVDIMLHEMGHDADQRIHGKSTGEDYANWVNKACKESARPDFYPAPEIDWDA